MLSRKREPESDLYSIEDLATASKILLLLDGYRKLYLEDFGWADIDVTEGKMGRKFASDWKEIRELLLRFARHAGSQRKLLKLASYQQTLKTVGLIISSVSMVLTSMGAISFNFGYQWGRSIPQVMSYMLLPLVIGLSMTLAGPPLIARKISIELERLFYRKRDFVRESDSTLKNVCQKLILSIVKYLQSPSARALKKGSVERKKSLFERLKSIRIRKKEDKQAQLGLFYTDYAKIKVVKRPSLFRKYYLVSPDIE